MAVPSRRKTASEKPPRRRRDAASARAAILDAAERRLAEAGPAGIRLQDVAADVGVSHPTVLHHFGNREALVNAVITRSFTAIRSELVTAILGSTGGAEQLRGILDRVFHALSAGGHGRVLLWLALEGHPIGSADVKLTDVVDAAHALRIKKRRGDRGDDADERGGRGGDEGRQGAKMPSREDTAHTVVLGALALLSAAVLGPALMEDAGLEGDEEAGARFRAWLAKVLVAHLESGPAGGVERA